MYMIIYRITHTKKKINGWKSAPPRNSIPNLLRERARAENVLGRLLFISTQLTQNGWHLYASP
ncbi:hypothetical protein Hanom_Chr10g00922801 [Helianthus anomalus]